MEAMDVQENATLQNSEQVAGERIIGFTIGCFTGTYTKYTEFLYTLLKHINVPLDITSEFNCDFKLYMKCEYASDRVIVFLVFKESWNELRIILYKKDSQNPISIHTSPFKIYDTFIEVPQGFTKNITKLVTS